MQRTSVRPHVIPLERDLYKPATVGGAGGGGGGALRAGAVGTTVGDTKNQPLETA